MRVENLSIADLKSDKSVLVILNWIENTEVFLFNNVEDFIIFLRNQIYDKEYVEDLDRNDLCSHLDLTYNYFSETLSSINIIQDNQTFELND